MRKRREQVTDESGDFGTIDQIPSYYLVTLVFHDQENDITQNVRRLEQSIRNAGFSLEYIHTGPLIRREEVFADMTIDQRRQLLFKMLNFFVSCPIKCYTVSINRKEAPDRVSLSERLKRELYRTIVKYDSLFRNYDKIIIYYDNGQRELSSIIHEMFSGFFSNVEFRRAEPQKYRLLQAADFVCTLELLRIKQKNKRLSKSEETFFYKPNELKKTFLKAVERKTITSNTN